MPTRYNPAPGWPTPPPGWQPPPGWKPDPSWPAPPVGWQVWIETNPQPSASPKRSRGLFGAAATLLGLLLAFGAWFFPRINDPDKVSSPEQRAEYVATVNGLCRNALGAIAEIQATEPADVTGFQRTSEQMTQVYDDLIERWSALAVPAPGDRPQIRSMLDDLERISRAIHDMGFAATISDPELQRDAIDRASSQGDEAGADFRSAAGLYGVGECLELGR